MNIFSSLQPSEQARQLANPEGPVGLEIAEWLNGNNAQSNAKALDALELVPDCRVLEIGFGNGRAAANIRSRCSRIEYVGVDISPTMLEEATRFNAASIDAGQSSFHLVSADRMPFPDAYFNRVFSIGVMHFWADPLPTLTEVRRVCQVDCLVLMVGLNPRSTTPFAKEEYGFHVRTPEEWVVHFGKAGFRSVDAQCVEVESVGADGKPNRRYTTRMTARP